MKKFLSHPWYIALALAFAVALYVGISLYSSASLITTILTTGSQSLVQSCTIVAQLVIANIFQINLSAFMIAISSLLGGFYVAMMIFLMQLRRSLPPVSHMSLGSLAALLALFGFGCAACGSLVIASLLGSFGGAWLIAYMPLEGQEFGILGMVLIAVSIYFTARAINRPLVC